MTFEYTAVYLNRVLKMPNEKSLHKIKGWKLVTKHSLLQQGKNLLIEQDALIPGQFLSINRLFSQLFHNERNALSYDKSSKYVW